MAVSIASTAPHSPLSVDSDKYEQRPLWHRLGKWISGREDESPCEQEGFKPDLDACKPSLSRRLSRRVPGLPMVNLPRPATFRRQNSERRDRLLAVQPTSIAPRTASVNRRRAMSERPASLRPLAVSKLSVPIIPTAVVAADNKEPIQSPAEAYASEAPTLTPIEPPHPEPPPSAHEEVPTTTSEASFDDELEEQIKDELEKMWILNLSMHFRDNSPREKFFVTYAETPARWRRVTVSCDYRDAPPDSLERDLQALQYQRDKSARIYEAIRLSLPDIKFYETVTNLKLETSQDDRLHVHVTEDVHEIIPYPPTSAVQHLKCRKVREADVHFDSHMSGFVYKVNVDGHTWIKKEIPGPDSVEEFLYEINALHALQGSQNVIQFQGLVVDEKNELVKGLLISYADQGPMVDLIFDYKPNLEWARREKWARQIVHGLSEIHEAGFVQGDFTLSNIVIDEHDTAQIIDINRRGCPVGWEPPEIARLIESGQRISMYIGVKSDIFQLGMVLWAIAEEEDEPERQCPPLSFRDTKRTIPEYYRTLTERCLCLYPNKRPSAKDLLALFPFPTELATSIRPALNDRTNSHSLPSETHYIDPSHAVEREDLALHNTTQDETSRQFSSPSHTYIDRRDSIDIPFDGPGSYIISRRGRLPPLDTRLEYPFSQPSRNPSMNPSNASLPPQIIPISPNGERKWETIELDGEEYIVQRTSLDLEEAESERLQRSLRSAQRIGGTLGMEHVDSGLADMELVGVGGNEALVWEAGTVWKGEELEKGEAGSSEAGRKALSKEEVRREAEKRERERERQERREEVEEPRGRSRHSYNDRLRFEARSEG